MNIRPNFSPQSHILNSMDTKYIIAGSHNIKKPLQGSHLSITGGQESYTCAVT